jgi:hypothetical protein
LSLRPAARALAALDALIVALAGAVLLYLLAGGFDLGLVSARRLSKPLLLLVVLGGLRAALPGSSWLAVRLAAGARRAASTLAGVEERSPWARGLVAASIAVLSVHVVSKGTAFLANLLFGAARARPFGMPFGAARFAETFAAWDSGWYFDIARRGYYWSADGQSSLAFFPLYPMLMRALAWPFGGSDRSLWIAGVVLSYSCLLLGLAVLHRLAEDLLGDREAARRAVLYLAVFPFAYFFTQVYAESLFLLVSVAAVAAAFASRFALAGLFGALAVLARPNGILLGAPLLLIALAARPRPALVARRLLALAPVPLAFVGFCAFAERLSGDPLGWLHAQSHWGFSVGHAPWVELMRLVDGIDRFGPYGYFFSDPLAPYYLLHGGVALAFVALTPSVFRRLGPALGVYVALSLYLPLSGNALEGVGRYAATLFPVFLLLGAATTSRRVQEAWLITSALLLSLLSALFATWRPIY